MKKNHGAVKSTMFQFVSFLKQLSLGVFFWSHHLGAFFKKSNENDPEEIQGADLYDQHTELEWPFVVLRYFEPESWRCWEGTGKVALKKNGGYFSWRFKDWDWTACSNWYMAYRWRIVNV